MEEFSNTLYNLFIFNKIVKIDELINSKIPIKALIVNFLLKNTFYGFFFHSILHKVYTVQMLAYNYKRKGQIR